ncbi:MAG: glycerol-3-phosphate dehydrogenase, partial [Pseudomonadota bacterium]
AIALARGNAHQVTLWARDASLCADMVATRENQRYLPGQVFPPQLQVCADFESARADAELILLATPLAGLRPSLQRLQAQAAHQPLLWLCKGLEAGTGLLPHQVVAEVLGSTRIPYGALTGPSFAEEVARGLPTAITLASADTEFSRATAQALAGARLRIYANDDLIGAEVGGAVKNVLAIASGISDGLGLGHNARAALLTRGLAEIVRLGVALGARRETLMGLAGMGDLILTCTGDLSRNRRVGLALAAGRSLADIVRELGHVAEGVASAREVARRALENNVDMPIVQAVCAVLDNQLPPLQAVDRLMSRDPKDE